MDVFLSDSHGLDWKQILSLTSTGHRVLTTTPWVFRRYDYRLRFVPRGTGTGLNSLRVSHDAQHSQRALPALGQGTVTFPVPTPGDMTRLRFGGHCRARDAKDGYDAQVSFDGGKTCRTIERFTGPTQGKSRRLTVSDVPAGTRSALARFSGQQANTTCIFSFRIDADYREPAGGLKPVRVTYVWDESGTEKRDVHTARGPRDTWDLTCAAKPTMKSIVLEPVE